MNRTSSRVAVSLATLLALTAFACSGATPDSGVPDSKSPSTASKPSTPAKDDSSTTDTSPATPAPPSGEANACGTKKTAQECGDCCIATNPDAVEVADKAYFGCLCAPATCAAACAESVCATADNNNEPSAACTTCIDAQEPACEQKAAAACDGDAACKAVDACFTASCDPIAQTEEQSGGGNAGARPSQVNARAARATSRQR